MALNRFHIAEKKGFKYDKNFAVLNGRDVYEKMIGEFECINAYEEMFVIYLNNRNNILGIAKIGQGNSCGTIANIKLGMKIALDLQATGIILCHNHPSDCTTPSQEDKRMTMNFVDACKLFEMKMLDHVIVAESGFLSFNEVGLL